MPKDRKADAFAGPSSTAAMLKQRRELTEAGHPELAAQVHMNMDAEKARQIIDQVHKKARPNN